MKYTITEIGTGQIKVTYEDGSNAEIPIQKGQSNEGIRMNVKMWSGTAFTPFDSTSDVPVALNFAGDTEDDLTTPNEYDYKAIRAAKYPAFGDQLDAAYKARLGDTSEQTTVDAAIAAVKTKYPKDDTKYTDSDLV